MNSELLETLPGFHALTGRNTTSYIAGQSKKICWEVFKEHHIPLESSPVLSDHTIKDTEEWT